MGIFNKVVLPLLFILSSSNNVDASFLSDEELIALHRRFLSADKLETFKQNIEERRLRGRGGGGRGQGGGGGGGGFGMMGGDGPGATLQNSESTTAAGGGGGGGGGGLTPTESQRIQNLFDNRKFINRTVVPLFAGDGTLLGIKSATTSEDKTIVSQLQKHVAEMHNLVHDDRNLRMWDPLFKELLGRRLEIDMTVKNTTYGVEVEEVGDDQCAAYLVQGHSEAVSMFLKNGHANQAHDLPQEYINDIECHV